MDRRTLTIDQRTDENSFWGQVGRIGLAQVGVALATLMGWGLQSFTPPTSVALLYVLPVIGAAITAGRGPAMTAAVSGALAFDFFFVDPRYSLRIASPGDIASTVLLLAIASAVAALASQSRERALRAGRMAAQADALRALAHAIINGAPRPQIIERAAMSLSQAFGAPAFIIAHGSVLSSSGRPVRLRPDDFEVAQAALDAGAATQAGHYKAGRSRLDFWPVRLPDGQGWVIGLDLSRQRDERAADADSVVEAVAAYLAVAFPL